MMTIDKLPWLVRLSRHSGIIRQNIALSLLIKGVVCCSHPLGTLRALDGSAGRYGAPSWSSPTARG